VNLYDTLHTVETQSTIWAAAASLRLTVRELGEVLGLSFGVASKKMRGAVAWTLDDIEALNRVLPPERQLKLVAGDFTEPLMQPVEPVVVPVRAKSELVSQDRIMDGFYVDALGRLRPKGNKEERDAAVARRRAAVLELLGLGKSTLAITQELGFPPGTVRDDIQELRKQGLITTGAKAIGANKTHLGGISTDTLFGAVAS